MDKYETSKLYIVKPSIVIDDDTKKIGYDTVTDEAKYKTYC